MFSRFSLKTTQDSNNSMTNSSPGRRQNKQQKAHNWLSSAVANDISFTEDMMPNPITTPVSGLLGEALALETVIKRMELRQRRPHGDQAK